MLVKAEIIHGMPFADYRAHPAISQSSLKILLKGTPADLRSSLEAERKQTKAMRIGSIEHFLLLQPEELGDNVFMLPPEFKDFKTAAARAWRDQHEEQGHLVYTTKEEAHILGMAHAVRGHPILGPLLRKGRPEVSLVATEPETGVEIKCRSDWFPDPSLIADGPLPVLDLKTAEDSSVAGFTRVIDGRRYDMQGAMNLLMCELCGIPRTCFLLGAVKSSPPYIVEVFQLGAAKLAKAREDLMNCLRIYKECLETDTWPGSTNAINLVELC